VDDDLTGTIPASWGGDTATLCCWLRLLNTVAAYEVIWAGGSITGSQGLYLGANGTSLVAGVVGHVEAVWSLGARRILDRWVRVCVLYRGNGAKVAIYTDGTLRAESPVNATTQNISGTVSRFGRHLNATLPTRMGLGESRLYKGRLLTPTEIAADARGEAVDSTGLVRRWTCENPGYGTTCREEVGGTNDAITGALWSPVVPFRRRRVVEDVAAAVLGTGTLTCTVPHHADLDPAAGSFSFGVWTSARGVSGDIIAQKDDGAAGWILDFTAGGALRLRLRDGALTITVTGSALLRSAWGDADRRDRHVEFTVDRTGGYAYLAVDSGPPARTALGALGSIANVSDMVFGAGASGVVGGLNDAVLHKGTAWTWDQRDALYYDGDTPDGAIAWPMREGAGTTAASSPAGYDGTLSAASWTTKTRCKARTAA
jgi:hypothetical protein